jgi:hypothetical protein
VAVVGQAGGVEVEPPAAFEQLDQADGRQRMGREVERPSGELGRLDAGDTVGRVAAQTDAVEIAEQGVGLRVVVELAARSRATRPGGGRAAGRAGGTASCESSAGDGRSRRTRRLCPS